MDLCIFKEFKHPLRKCLKEILIRWREWTSMGLVLPSRCALLAWLFKPLNLLQHKSSTKIAENNQYAPAALFTSQKLFPTIIPSLANSHLFFFFTPILDFPHSFPFPLCLLVLVIPHPSLPSPRQSRPVCLTLWTSCPLFYSPPSGLCVPETAWHCWGSGYRANFPRWDPECCQHNFLIFTQLKEHWHSHTLHTVITD